MGAFTITVPKTTQWSPQAATGLIHSILKNELAQRMCIEFGIKATSQHIEPFINFYEETFTLAQLATLVKAFYPISDISPLYYDEMVYPLHRRAAIFSRASRYYFERAIRADEFSTPDPLILFIQIMEGLRENEEMGFSVVWRGTYQESQAEIDRDLLQTRFEASGKTPSDTSIFMSWLGGTLQQDGELVPRFSPAEEYQYRRKLQYHLHRVYLTLYFDTPDPSRLHLFTAASNQIKAFSHPMKNLIGDGYQQTSVVNNDDEWSALHPVSTLFKWTQTEKDQHKNKLREEQLFKHTLYLVPEEIAGLWHLPYESFQSSRIAWMNDSRPRLPQALRGRHTGTCLGDNIFNRETEPVYMSDEDRHTHIHIVGKTGTGKSTLLHHLIHQDISQGRGVAVIDPQGKLIQDILGVSIPARREKDIVVLDVANEAYPPPMNLLALPKGVEQNNAAARLMTILEKYGSFTDTITVAPALRAALLTLWHEKTPTIRDVIRLFSDVKYRHTLLEQVEHPVVEDYWTRFEAKSAGNQEQIIAPILNRLGEFYGNPLLYPILCHPDGMDFVSLIREQKIVLVSLAVDKAAITPSEQNLLGSILVTQLQMAAMSGAATQAPFYVYIDEVHRFITTPLHQMLSEVRQYKFSLTLAHQYLKQLAGDTLEAVIGNVGTLIAFQCGIDDARALAPYMKPNFDADDLLNLDLYSAAVSMRSGGHTQPSFSLTTRTSLKRSHPAVEARANEREKLLRKMSIEQYTPKSQQEVLTWLKNRYPRKARDEDTKDVGQDYDPTG